MTTKKLLVSMLVFGLVFGLSNSSWGQFNTQKKSIPLVSPSTTTVSPDLSAVEELLQLPKVVSAGVVNVSVTFFGHPYGSYWKANQRVYNSAVRSDSIILLTAQAPSDNEKFYVICTVSNKTAGSFTMNIKTAGIGWAGSAGETYSLPVAYAIINPPK